MQAVVGVASGAGVKKRKLRGHRFAQHHSASLSAHGHAGGIGHRPVVGIHARAIVGGKVGGVKQVFHAQRQAMQQAFNRA